MITAKEIMTAEVKSVLEETTIEELARLFVEGQVSAMPVVDEEQHLRGFISESDLVEQNMPLHLPRVISLFDWVLYMESEKNFREEVERITAQTVGEICVREVISCSVDTPLREIAELMSSKQVNLLPVVEDEKVVGVVSRLDVVRSMAR
ncbi:MAG: hypothetical protein C0624_07730 [Desulfuromonas sp.]|nr:MAG: hypothetical protein C0624_07730 [Desulfuromonas sp.]